MPYPICQHVNLQRESFINRFYNYVQIEINIYVLVNHESFIETCAYGPGIKGSGYQKAGGFSRLFIINFSVCVSRFGSLLGNYVWIINLVQSVRNLIKARNWVAVKRLTKLTLLAVFTLTIFFSFPLLDIYNWNSVFTGIFSQEFSMRNNFNKRTTVLITRINSCTYGISFELNWNNTQNIII